MIYRRSAERFCCEDISLIENYKEAVSSPERWDCHHKLEVQDGKVTSRADLIKQGLYYNRPASELIFLTQSEHTRLHSKNRLPETITKISEYMKNRIITEETKDKIRKTVKEYQLTHPITEEQHQKMSYIQQNMKFFNNGIVSTKALECPEGFVPGRLKYKSRGSKGMNWYTNGKTQILCLPQDKPEGFKPGKLPYSEEHNKNVSLSKKKLMQNPEYIKKLSDANKGKKRYTNGINNITIDGDLPCPEGYWNGVTKKKSSKNTLF